MGSGGMSHALNVTVKRLFILGMILTSRVLPVQCATLERLTLDEMITRSTRIVRGRVAASRTAFTGAVIYTHYTIQVSESFKGAPQDAVEIMVPGGTVNGQQQSFSGSPVLTPGNEFVFFLWTGRNGITWITGLTQGLFALPADVASDRLATRPASRELMLDAATSHAVKDSALSLKLSELRTRIAATLAAQGGAK